MNIRHGRGVSSAIFESCVGFGECVERRNLMNPNKFHNETIKIKTLIEEVETRLYNISQEKLLVAVESKGEGHVRCINGIFL